MKRVFFCMNFLSLLCMVIELMWLSWIDSSGLTYNYWQLAYGVVTKIPITWMLGYYGYHLLKAMGFKNLKIKEKMNSPAVSIAIKTRI